MTAHRLAIGKAFCQLSGNDETALPYNAAGGAGCISVTANVAPKLCADFQAATVAGDTAEAHRLNELLTPLHNAMFADASPAPVKYALSKVLPWLNDEVRLPLVACSADARRTVDTALSMAELL